MSAMPQFIVCAAMRKGKFIACGARHFDAVMRRQIVLCGLDFEDWEQGFIDQYGNFLTRAEAWKIADARGQIRRRTALENNPNPRRANIGDEGLLFSENLY